MVSNQALNSYFSLIQVLIAQRKAVGVEFIFSNVSFQVLANKEVILSSGSYGTPKILLQSGIGPRGHLDTLQVFISGNMYVCDFNL